MPESISLSVSECRLLLRAGVVGRIAVNTTSGPPIVPVNYAVVDDAVVVRTAADSVLGAMPEGTLVAFEVEHEYQHGWSTVVHWRLIMDRRIGSGWDLRRAMPVRRSP